MPNSAGTVSGCDSMTWAASTAPTSTAHVWRISCSQPVTRSRSASSSWSRSSRPPPSRAADRGFAQSERTPQGQGHPGPPSAPGSLRDPGALGGPGCPCPCGVLSDCAKPRSAALLGGGRDERDQLELADLDLVTGCEQLILHTCAVDVGAVEAAHVMESHPLTVPAELGMTPADGDVVQEDVAVRMPPHRHDLAVEQEAGPAVGPSYGDQQRGPRVEIRHEAGDVQTALLGFEDIGALAQHAEPTRGAVSYTHLR